MLTTVQRNDDGIVVKKAVIIISRWRWRGVSHSAGLQYHWWLYWLLVGVTCCVIVDDGPVTRDIQSSDWGVTMGRRDPIVVEERRPIQLTFLQTNDQRRRRGNHSDYSTPSPTEGVLLCQSMTVFSIDGVYWWLKRHSTFWRHSNQSERRGCVTVPINDCVWRGVIRRNQLLAVAAIGH